MRPFLRAAHRCLIGFVLLMGLVSTVCGADHPAARTNVLLVVSDDLNCRLGCYGDPTVKTPNIDRLAAQGVRFARAYCNYPVCNASRTSFLSSRYPDTTGIFTNGVDPRTNLGPEFEFLPEYFRSRGYYAAGLGKIPHTPEHIGSIKWDLYDDPEHLSEGDDKKTSKDAGLRKQDDPNQFTREWPDERQPDGISARRAVGLIEEHCKEERPFFLAVGFHRPHGPRIAPQNYFDRYPPAGLPLPAPSTIETDGIPPIAVPPQYEPDKREPAVRDELQSYFATVTFMDTELGLLLDALDRQKLWDRTVVLFMSDHGYHLGEHGGFWGKQSLMEELDPAPLIVAAPGMGSGATAEGLVEYVDVFPTLADLCGLPAPPGAHGRSFRSQLSDPAGPGKPAVYTVCRRDKLLGRCITTERYAYIEWPDGARQLYDLADDPDQRTNLASRPDFAGTVADLAERLAKARAAAGG